METNAFSQSYNLGGLIAEHRANPKAQKESLLAGWGLIAVGAIFAIIGLAVSKGEWPDLLIAAAGLPVALIGVFALLGRQRRRDLCVRLFTDGFTRTLGGQTVAVRWDDVTEVWQNVIETYRGSAHTNTTYIYTVRLADGRKFVFNNQVDKIAGLGAAMQKACAERMFPRARAACDAGESVAFGPFAVSRIGLSAGGKTLPWEQVERVELRRGVLHVMQKGQRRDWAFAMASKIPNLPVLMALANQNSPKR